jgi:hypothetical protein
VCWRNERATKVPKIAGTSRNASSADPKTWRSFAECVKAAKRRPGFYAGVGFVFTKADPFVGVDLDDVRNPATGTLSERAADVVSLLASYAEVSPSGTGVKVWVRAQLERAKKKPGVEIYPHGRFFAVTGQMLAGTRSRVEERQAELDTLVREEFPKPEEPPRHPYEGPPGERIELAEILEAGGVGVMREIPDGTAEKVYSIVCPWVHEHGGGDKSGTRVGQYSDGALWFRCEHAHCACRGWDEFREYIKPTPRMGRSKARRLRRRHAA